MDVTQVDSIPLQSRVALNLNFVFAHRQFIQGDFFSSDAGEKRNVPPVCHRDPGIDWEASSVIWLLEAHLNDKGKPLRW